jgi:hypothetical protein
MSLAVLSDGVEALTKTLPGSILVLADGSYRVTSLETPFGQKRAHGLPDIFVSEKADVPAKAVKQDWLTGSVEFICMGVMTEGGLTGSRAAELAIQGQPASIEVAGASGDLITQLKVTVQGAAPKVMGIDAALGLLKVSPRLFKGGQEAACLLSGGGTPTSAEANAAVLSGSEFAIGSPLEPLYTARLHADDGALLSWVVVLHCGSGGHARLWLGGHTEVGGSHHSMPCVLSWGDRLLTISGAGGRHGCALCSSRGICSCGARHPSVSARAGCGEDGGHSDSWLRLGSGMRRCHHIPSCGGIRAAPTHPRAAVLTQSGSRTDAPTALKMRSAGAVGGTTLTDLSEWRGREARDSGEAGTATRDPRRVSWCWRRTTRRRVPASSMSRGLDEDMMRASTPSAEMMMI